MDELYLLKKQLDEINKKIPKYEIDDEYIYHPGKDSAEEINLEEESEIDYLIKCIHNSMERRNKTDSRGRSILSQIQPNRLYTHKESSHRRQTAQENTGSDEKSICRSHSYGRRKSTNHQPLFHSYNNHPKSHQGSFEKGCQSRNHDTWQIGYCIYPGCYILYSQQAEEERSRYLCVQRRIPPFQDYDGG